MGFMDKVREQSTQLAQKAQETAREGKVKLDQAQAKRRADAIFRDLGASVYAERTGRAGVDNPEKIDRLVEALSRQEADQGLGDTEGTPPAPAGPPPTSASPPPTPAGPPPTPASPPPTSAGPPPTSASPPPTPGAMPPTPGGMPPS